MSTITVAMQRNTFHHIHFTSQLERVMFEQWRDDSSYSWAYFIHEGNKIISLALLRRCDFDPLKTHNKPCCLSLIWTDPSARRHGYASKLLEHAKERHELTLAPIDESAEAFFLQRGFEARRGVLRCPS